MRLTEPAREPAEKAASRLHVTVAPAVVTLMVWLESVCVEVWLVVLFTVAVP